MSLNVQTARAFRTPAERRELITAIRDAHEQEFELDWLEWKSTVDLTDKAWHCTIARHVLGFANRHPDAALQNVEGFAFLLVGVEPGDLSGVQLVDSADLEDGIARYVGSNGPRWTFGFETLGSTAVLVVTVEPPRWGDSIFTLRKQFGKYRNGAIFIRRRGKTEKANSEEIHMLERRAAVAASDRLAVDLRWWNDEPRPIQAIDTSDEVRDRWLERERKAVTALYQAPRMQEKTLTGVRAMMPREPIPTPESFERDLKTYIERIAAEFVLRSHRWAIRKAVAVIDPAIVNLTEHNYADVAVGLRFPGAVSAFLSEAHATGDTRLTPRPKYGPTSPVLSQLWTSELLSGKQPRPPGAIIDNSGSAEIRFKGTHVRPEHSHRLETFHLLADASLVGTPLVGHWWATSTTASGTAHGTFTIEVEETPVHMA